MNDPLGDLLSALSNYGVNLIGQPTSVNGEDYPDGAEWTEAAPSRITTFLNDNEWGKAAYDVVFPASVLDSPWSLAYGSEVLQQRTGLRCAVRRIDIPGIGNTNLNVLALVVVGK